MQIIAVKIAGRDSIIIVALCVIVKVSNIYISRVARRRRRRGLLAVLIIIAF